MTTTGKRTWRSLVRRYCLHTIYILLISRWFRIKGLGSDIVCTELYVRQVFEYQEEKYEKGISGKSFEPEKIDRVAAF
jgi:hypothetical protein